MKKLTAMAAAALACVAMAQESTTPELEEASGDGANWRLTIGGFGRGNVKTRLKGGSGDHKQFWGADMDLQYSVWANQDFNVWVGIGGTFCPNQDAYSGIGGSRRSEHQVSDDGYVTYDFNYATSERRSVELGYGELRMMAVPEWNVTERFALGARVGVAFDWIRAKCEQSSSWRWDSQFVTDIPGILATTDVDSDAGRSGYSEGKTKFAAQAILGLQATYLFTDYFGIYAACDWRLGGDTTFNTGYGDAFVIDMSGWYASAGLVVQF